MSAFMKFEGITIPYVHAVKERMLIGADKARSADFTLNQIVFGVKTVWDAETRVMTSAEASTLIAHLKTTLFSEGDFWWKDFGAESITVKAVITDFNIEYEGFGDRSTGAWTPIGKILTMTVEEV